MDAEELSLTAAWYQSREDQWDEDVRTARMCSVVATCLTGREFDLEMFMPPKAAAALDPEAKEQELKRRVMAWVGRVGGGAARPKRTMRPKRAGEEEAEVTR